MSENEPPTTPAAPTQPAPPTPYDTAAPGPAGSRWSRLRPRGRAVPVLFGVGGFVLGLVVAGVLLLATPLGGGDRGPGHGPGRATAGAPDGRGGPGLERGARGGPDGGPGRAGGPAAGAGGPVIQVQPGGTVIVQPGATVQPPAAPAPAPAAPVVPGAPTPAAPAAPAAPAPAAPVPTR